MVYQTWLTSYGSWLSTHLSTWWLHAAKLSGTAVQVSAGILAFRILEAWGLYPGGSARAHVSCLALREGMHLFSISAHLISLSQIL